jgi:hypothetical protein
METENEDIKKENQEEQEPTWLENIKEEISHMDTDFPLSGGDESHPAVHHVDKDEEDIEAEDEKILRRPSLYHDLECEFPLYGGEV